MMITNLKNSDEKQQWLFASTLLNALLAAAKLAWGFWMGSTLVTADGIHSLSDVFGALLIFLALHFAAHKSARFPYGLHKLEDMAALFGGFGILFAGYEIIHSVFFEAGIRTPNEIWMTVGFILVIIVIQIIFYFFELKAAKRLSSPGVRADAINWLGDIGAGMIVTIGLVAHHFHIPYAQEAAVVIIVLMIFQGAYEVLKEGLLSLLDAADAALSSQISDIVLAMPEVSKINCLSVRKSGSVYFADLEITIQNSSMKRAHLNVDHIVEALHADIDALEAVTIHYEPEHPTFKTTVVLLQDDKETISTTFGTAPWIRLVKTGYDGEHLSESIVKNPFLHVPRGKAFRLVAWMIKEHVDVVVINAKELDENVAILFDTLGIEVQNETAVKQSKKESSC